uniref:NADH dehydrogenase subunit 2 n=1 Tax=Distenia punctulatoides TaxID=2980435 RepID=UPI0021D531F2|nr:NADH dehydrogenase subunit 2 [Distenia punctulatoides]UXG19096.1 NADH dehydrogenase subunit 2 [Distenia punctulatoides]
MKFYMILFFVSMIFGTLLTISAYSWLSMWMGLEINLLSIIPLMSNIKNLYPSEAALKYFITQALASSILLFSIILLMNLTDIMGTNLALFMILNSALLTKMGAAPFHFWFPEVLEGLSWLNSLILLTWQKLAPMAILSYNTKLVLFLSTIVILSSAIGGILGLNQVSLRKIMAFSSINHMGWMIASIMLSSPVWFNYFLIYSTISMNLIMIFHYLKLFFINQINSTLMTKKITKISLIMNFFSLGGLPPFLGFYPKWVTINFLTSNSMLLLSLILVTLTLITLFFYMRICFSSLMINNFETALNSSNMPFFMMLVNFMTLAGLIAGPMILSMT